MKALSSTFRIAFMSICMLIPSHGLTETSLIGAYFDANSATLRPDAKAALKESAVLLKSATQFDIGLVASSCDTELNPEALSFKRAIAVRDFLVTSGIASARLRQLSLVDSKRARHIANIYKDEPCPEGLRFVDFELIKTER